MNDDHDEDQDGFYAVAVPNWRFSLWDIAGITLFTAGHVAQAIGNGLGLFARECSAAANRSRQDHEVRAYQRHQAEAQAAIGEDLRALIEGDGS